jgi:hypothetical protein
MQAIVRTERTWNLQDLNRGIGKFIAATGNERVGKLNLVDAFDAFKKGELKGESKAKFESFIEVLVADGYLTIATTDNPVPAIPARTTAPTNNAPKVDKPEEQKPVIRRPVRMTADDFAFSLPIRPGDTLTIHFGAEFCVIEYDEMYDAQAGYRTYNNVRNHDASMQTDCIVTVERIESLTVSNAKINVITADNSASHCYITSRKLDNQGKQRRNTIYIPDMLYLDCNGDTYPVTFKRY